MDEGHALTAGSSHPGNRCTQSDTGGERGKHCHTASRPTPAGSAPAQPVHVADLSWSQAEQVRYQRELERARELAEAALQEKEHAQGLLEFMMSAAPVGFAFLDCECRYVCINDHLARISDRPPQDHIGRSVHEVLPPQVAEVTQRCVERVLQTGQAVQQIALSEDALPGARRQQHRHWLADYYPVRSGDGATILGVGVVVNDVTALKQAEAEAARQKESAEAANRAKDQFLAILSHELRTPLTPVLSTVTALSEDASLPAETRSALQMVRRNVAMQTRLIDDLLDLTRIARGKLQVDPAVIDARLPIGNAVETCLPEIRQKQIALVLELDPQRPFVHADPTRLQQVVWNLLRNAVKFTPPHGKITVRCRNDEAGWLGIQVIDSGLGIEPAMLSRIFTAFDQGDPGIGRRFGGLGLGLAISRALVEAHGGQLTASSAGRNHGATFTVHLPTVDEPVGGEDAGMRADPAPAATPAAAAPGSCVAHPAPLRILLVEDHQDTLHAMRRLLHRAGYEVFAADSIAAALQVAQQQQSLDLLISDIGLPDGTGLELLAQVRTIQPTVKAIALSGYGMEEDIRRSKDAGFQAHVTKPIDLHTLQAVINQWLPGRR